MVSPTKRMTVEEFDEWVNLEENADKLFEFIGGEIVEVPSNPYSSEVAYEIGFHIKLFLREKGIKGHVTGEAGGYKVSGERYAPDVAYISSEKQQDLPYRQGYNPNPPELAVEVMSPTDDERQLSIKISNYLAAGTVVWVVRPDTKEVDIHSPNQPAKVLGEKDTLDGGKVLEGFSLPVKEIFPQK